MTATPPPARPTPAATAAGPRALPRLLASLVALTTILVMLLLLFILPALKSGPHDLPIGTVGEIPATAALTTGLEAIAPGAFEAADFADEDALRTAILDRTIVGGLVVDAGDVRLLTATAGSAAITGALTQATTAATAAAGLPVTVEDLVPYPSADPSGIGIGGLAFPLVFGGIVPAAVAMKVFSRSLRLQIASAGAFALVGGLVVTTVLRYGFGSWDGSIVRPAAALALGIAAISIPLLGMQSLLGGKGFTGLAASMMFLGNPLAGIGTSAAWLPSGLGLLGQLLPPGSTGTLVRSAAYFGGKGAGTSVAILAAWVAVGLTLCAVGARRQARAADAELDAILAAAPGEAIPA